VDADEAPYACVWSAAEQFQEWGIEPGNLSFRALHRHGFLLKDWGQVYMAHKQSPSGAW
jgi:hypothetical protein